MFCKKNQRLKAKNMILTPSIPYIGTLDLLCQLFATSLVLAENEHLFGGTFSVYSIPAIYFCQQQQFTMPTGETKLHTHLSP